LLVENYGQEVTTILNIIAHADESELSLQTKLDFFNDTRQSFGCSALILKSGASFGTTILNQIRLSVQKFVTV
jgi:TAG lipase/lysophosphatidylethanolamine acyltransferase